MLVPAAVGWYGLGAGVLLGLAIALVGLAGLLGRARAFRKRFDAYANLPLLKELELAQARIDIGDRALASLPSLQFRATRAFREIEEAREQIRASLFTVSNGVGVLVSLVFGER
jgi:hypothetical protein